MGGYHPSFRCYGGGEVYLDMKWWMQGSTVMMVPEALGYHLSAGRGYSFKQDDLIHNMMLLGYALNADAMAERVFLRYLGKPGVNTQHLADMHNDAFAEAAEDRANVRAPHDPGYSFYDAITQRPWDQMNIALHGKASSGLLIYDRTWVEELSGEAKRLFDESALQKELQVLIDGPWAPFVYKGLP